MWIIQCRPCTVLYLIENGFLFDCGAEFHAIFVRQKPASCHFCIFCNTKLNMTTKYNSKTYTQLNYSYQPPTNEKTVLLIIVSQTWFQNFKPLAFTSDSCTMYRVDEPFRFFLMVFPFQIRLSPWNSSLAWPWLSRAAQENLNSNNRGHVKS